MTGLFLLRLAKVPKYRSRAKFFKIFAVFFIIIGVMIGTVSLVVSVYNDIGIIQGYIENGELVTPSACAADS
jgi:hypothetical protein